MCGWRTLFAVRMGVCTANGGRLPVEVVAVDGHLVTLDLSGFGSVLDGALDDAVPMTCCGPEHIPWLWIVGDPDVVGLGCGVHRG